MNNPPTIPADTGEEHAKAPAPSSQPGGPPGYPEPVAARSTPAAGNGYSKGVTTPGAPAIELSSQLGQPEKNGEPSPLHDYLAFFRGRAVVAAAVVLLILFSALTLLVVGAGLQPTPWDITVTHEIQEIPDVPVGVLLVAVSQPGFQPWNWIIVLALMAVFLAAFRRPVEAIFVALAGAGGLIAEIVKNLVDRPRPTPNFAHILVILKSYSFPSGHVTSYTVLYGFLFYLVFVHMPHGNPLRMALLVFFAIMIVLVGPSRVYMGQHWASDALAGYTLGFAYLLLLIELYRFWMKRDVKRKT
jgi:undecaprenyl-diphosphatase